MTATLAHLVRHPVKSVGHEEIDHAPLTEGRVLPFDRHWAISHEAAKFDAPLDAWAAKLNFLRGVAAPALMAVRAAWDGTRLRLSHPDLPEILLAPDDPADAARLIGWLAPLWPANRPAPRRLERPGTALTDMREPYVSILSLGSLRALGAAVGQDLSIHRFRGNLWIDGWEPAAERALIGQRLRIGGALLEVAMPITRCRATCANPETGAEDIETLDALESLWGNRHFGLYATVVCGGTVARGDAVEVV